MASGEFESKSLAALNAMVAKADPGLLTSRGQALGKAGSDMDGIGSELRTHIDRVEWDGEGGDAFREWGRQFALESMRFAAYVRTLGQHMVDAGQALTEAKAAVPEPESMCYADPEKDKARQEREESKRQEAINQLNRLSSYYRTTGESLRAAEEPDFKPLPDGKQHEGSGNSAPEAASGSNSTAYREHGTNSDRPTTGQSGTDRLDLPTAERSTPVFDRPTNTKLDSVAPLPVTEQRPQAVTPTLPQQSAAPPPPPATPMPPTGPIQRTGRAPNGGRPSVGSGGGSPSPRGPVKDGVMGGTPRHAGNHAPGTGSPRGTVTGDRAPMGRPTGSYPGATGDGAPMGRGMPSGRPFTPSPGSTGGASRSASFTPGGTGLVRRNTAPGVAGRPTGTNSPSENRRRGQDRPDYLAEDEETWAGRRDVVPPVID
ncbi:WXG100 family type VII secretion target [Streptomyces sp. CNQ085]|uniref:WXG100 family type VII secretion target n=1 Tax=Streptomyces sp. CNQ085 TaxID=2886944 RepID=UPI001F50E024|nr:WXG100 family type VII secretion target [Streptomyces sp. CNQ085]MCI0383662.1 WXG100 family type VII secretion target [Streptomyces sp. CNQ085]